MAKVKKASSILNKPVLRSGDVLNFAEAKAERENDKSGLVPKGDVRLTANIRQDLHLKLKIEAANRRTTVGELLEELVEKYL